MIFLSFMIRFLDFPISAMSFLRFLTLGVVGQTGCRGEIGETESIGIGGGGVIGGSLSLVSSRIDSTGSGSCTQLVFDFRQP